MVFVDSICDDAKTIDLALVKSVEEQSVVIGRPAGKDVEYRPASIRFEPHDKMNGLYG
jgi:hypothetical protein